MSKGYLTLMLHAHLPFVRHPEYPEFLEEDWLFEAMTETYIPLLRMMDRLWDDAVDFRLTMSVTPPLAEMLADPLLQERYAVTVAHLAELAKLQVDAKRGTPFHDAAVAAHQELSEAVRLFDAWERRLLDRFKLYQDRGRLEIITCGATHGFLPLLATDTGRRAQIEVAVQSYERHFGRKPRGIWLPESAYSPGVDELLADAGIQFFFMERHGVEHAVPRPHFGLHRPVLTPSGVAAFGRDPETSRQVWSADEGYPGDPMYREFYRDLGYDLPFEEVAPWLHSDGVRRNIGLKFHRITGKVDLHQKEPYVPEWARQRAMDHAGNFLFNRQLQIRHLHEKYGVRPHIAVPYDAELFGHWWFEGPIFLEYLFRKIAGDQDEIELITPSGYLDREDVHQEVTPALSSWGAEGYFKVWLNEDNAWIYPHLHLAEERMIELATLYPAAGGLVERALNQAGRELLLAQSSDWAFIITMKTTVPYAEKRTREHITRFNQIYEQVLSGSVDEAGLAEMERRDNLFPGLDYRVWIPKGGEGELLGAVRSAHL
ncbi:MAG: DUF1957 domain-containing protein [Deltaproteobacteria bacterium]|nr:DUF1957 domain-containing protein [Deltaproteobacteria bacterium]